MQPIPKDVGQTDSWSGIGINFSTSASKVAGTRSSSPEPSDFSDDSSTPPPNLQLPAASTGSAPGHTLHLLTRIIWIWTMRLLMFSLLIEPTIHAIRVTTCLTPLSGAVSFCAGSYNLASRVQAHFQMVAGLYDKAEKVCWLADDFDKMAYEIQLHGSRTSSRDTSSVNYNELGNRTSGVADKLQELCTGMVNTADRERHSFDAVSQILSQANTTMTKWGPFTDMRLHETEFQRALSHIDPHPFFHELSDLADMSSDIFKDLVAIKQYVDGVEAAATLRERNTLWLKPVTTSMEPKTSWLSWNKISDANIFLSDSRRTTLFDQILGRCVDAGQVLSKSTASMADFYADMTRLSTLSTTGLFLNRVSLRHVIWMLKLYETMSDFDAHRIEALIDEVGSAHHSSTLMD